MYACTGPCIYILYTGASALIPPCRPPLGIAQRRADFFCVGAAGLGEAYRFFNCMRVLGPGDGHGQAGRRRAAGTLFSKPLAPAYWCGRGLRLAPKSAAEGAALSPEGLAGAGFG